MKQHYSKRMKPNVRYNCEVCGKLVEKYIVPSDHAKHAFRFCSRQCKGAALSGSAHPLWKGGRCINDQGYVLVHRPNHPHADAKGMVREHRLVMEAKLGRTLTREEVVHHINGNTQDNRPENLQLMPNQAEHKRHEMKARKRDAEGRMLPK